MYRDYRLFLFDILLSIKKIKIYSEKFDNSSDFKYSMLEWDATIREFEIIGEATNNLIKEKIFNEDKRVIVNFRNILIHKYFGIDKEEVWQVIQKLDDLEKEILNVVKQFDYEDIIEELKLEYKNQQILDYLENLKKRQK